MSRSAQRFSNRRVNKVAESSNHQAKEKWIEERKSKKVNLLPKNENQRKALQSFEEDTISVLEGSAGSGKSYLACVWSANQVVDKQKYNKIVIGRVHTALANRTVGHRQGNLLDKLKNFHMPMIEYLSMVFGRTAVEMQLAMQDGSGYIELADMESLRGRSFGDGVIVIIDEAQLLLPDEIEAVTTRLGEGSKLILCGDQQQKDVPDSKCGLLYLEYIVNKYRIRDVGIVKFTVEDIVRSGIVRAFVKAYQKENTKEH